MPASPAIINERIAIILGVITLGFGLAAFFSCKSFVSIFTRLGLGNPVENPGYKVYYKYHSYYWWLFGIVLVSHIFVAISHTGLPAAGDPDAGIHWTILGFGLVGTVAAGVQFSSCRVCISLLSRNRSVNYLNNKTFKIFLKYHSYYWIVFFLLVGWHFGIGFYHAGIWPI